MSDHNGHGHETHGGAHDGNGHGHGGADYIPESSMQDKLLLLIATLCLGGLLWGGFGWFGSVPAKPGDHGGAAEHATADEHGEASAPAGGEPQAEGGASPGESGGEAH